MEQTSTRLSKKEKLIIVIHIKKQSTSPYKKYIKDSLLTVIIYSLPNPSGERNESK